MKRLAVQCGYDYDKQVQILQKSISESGGFRLRANTELVDCIYRDVINDSDYANGECIEIEFSF